MRTTFAALVAAICLLGAPALAGAAAIAVPAADIQQTPPVQPPSGQIDVDIDTNGGAWYTSPIWIAIGIIAVILIIALIVMAGRGGGTTVVRG
jgi:hypothetical protein